MSSRASNSEERPSSFELLDRRVQRWVYRSGWQELRDIQDRSIPIILQGERDLIVAAATAAGKTEAAFLPIASNLCTDPIPEGIGALYISPLKALINDQHQRLELLCEAAELALTSWHGDVGADAKKSMREDPRGILLITPESIESIFVNHGTSAPKIFGALRYVVIDELHSFIGSERGRQLQSLLHRVQLAGRRRPVRIGLSATLGEMATAAEFMRPGGGGSVEMIESPHDSRQLLVQLRGYIGAQQDPEDSAEGMREAAQSEGAADPDRLQIADHLYRNLRGTDNLVFANSRKSVEEFADLLRRRCEEERVPVEFFPHHGNLSKGLREEVEEMLREGSRPTTAICTSTLELGIDVGSVNCVGQIDPPFSAAALRQRLGRSGRKPGDPSILRMYVTESELEPRARPADELREGLVQSIALIDALIDGWFEPPVDGALHLSTLIQQVLSVIAQHGGALADDIWGALCGTGPFELDRQLFVRLLRGLSEREVIQQGGDHELLLTPRGEQIVGHYSFYSAFVTSEEYRLVADGREIGSMPVTSPLTEDFYLIFGGRRWQVVEVDDKRKVIVVIRAKGGKVPRFFGDGGHIHDEIRRRMRKIYEGDAEPRYLDAKAKGLLSEGRAGFRQLDLGRRQIVPLDHGSAYFPWKGDRTIATLALGIRRAGHHVEAQGVALVAPETPPAELRNALEDVFGSDAEPDPLALMGAVKNLETEKHHWLLDPELLLRDATVARLDLVGAKQAVAELPSTVAPTGPPTAPTRASTNSRMPATAATEFVVVDCETTGLHPSAHHRMVELAILNVDPHGEVVQSWSTLLRPERDLGATTVHGIHARELLDAPTFEEVLGDVIDRVAGKVIVAHNARFDRAFLESELSRSGVEMAPLPTLCTMELASRLAIGGTRRRLDDCCASLGIGRDGPHSALADAQVCAKVLSRYLKQYGMGATALIKGKARPAIEWPDSEERAPTMRRQPAFAAPVRSPLSKLISEAELPAGHGGEDVSGYLDLLERAIEDRRLDSAEQQTLVETAAMLGISAAELKRLHRDYAYQLIELARRDGEVTEREREDLFLVCEALGVQGIEERLRDGRFDMREDVGTEVKKDGDPGEEPNSLRGQTVCFTGALTCRYKGEPMTRERAIELATAAGLTVLPRVTKKLDLLVLADPNSMSGKARKAQDYGTRLIAETAFWEKIGVEVS